MAFTDGLLGSFVKTMVEELLGVTYLPFRVVVGVR